MTAVRTQSIRLQHKIRMRGDNIRVNVCDGDGDGDVNSNGDGDGDLYVALRAGSDQDGHGHISDVGHSHRRECACKEKAEDSGNYPPAQQHKTSDAQNDLQNAKRTTQKLTAY
jgi:hypothetical protein